MGGRGSRGRPVDEHSPRQPSSEVTGTDTGTDQPTANTGDEKTVRVNRRWERFVREAIAEVVANRSYNNDFVGMDALRAALDARGTTRDAQDKQLKRMSKDGTIILVPESNRKMLTDADHAAAIRIGGDDCHVVYWGEGHHRLPPEQ